MSKNKLALLRYKTIDQCLRKRYRKWSLQDLVEAVTHALHELEGIPTVSLRTVQLDIEHMRNGSLGYTAPIIVVNKKFYTYSDEQFSIQKALTQSQIIDKIHTIELKAERTIAAHLLKNPFFKDLCILERDEKSITFSLDTVLKFELEKEILGYGERLQVLSPDFLRIRIVEKIDAMTKLYSK